MQAPQMGKDTGVKGGGGRRATQTASSSAGSGGAVTGSQKQKAQSKEVVHKGLKKPALEEETHGLVNAETGALQELGGLAREVEDQLLKEFESLLARRAGKKPVGGTQGDNDDEERAQQQQEEDKEKDATYWKHMYERLRDVRETEAEKLLREVQVHSEQREKLVQDLMRQLKDPSLRTDGAAAMMAEEEAAAAAAAVTETTTTSSSGKGTQEEEDMAVVKKEKEELEAKITRLKRLILGYQRLTSICLSLEEEPPASSMDVDSEADAAASRLSRLSCTAINHLHKRAVKFEVEVDCDTGDASLLEKDALFRPVANKAYLPAYLRQELTLETKQCPMLLASVLKALYSPNTTTTATNNSSIHNNNQEEKGEATGAK